MDEVAEHFPALRAARVAVHRGGAPTMTADGRPILGRVPGLDGFYVASGCCVGGLSLSPAAGRAVADLIVDGKSDPDLSPLSIERFRDRYPGRAELEAACVQQYARRYTR
jgi:glycine/D-amino acid oxidase-like deaminating enzyme